MKCGSTLTDINVGNQLGLASSFFKSHDKTWIKYKRETVFGISINIKTGYSLASIYFDAAHLMMTKHALLGCYRGRISTIQPPLPSLCFHSAGSTSSARSPHDLSAIGLGDTLNLVLLPGQLRDVDTNAYNCM